MTDIEKLTLRLGMVLRNIDALYAEKKQLEADIKKYADSVREECSTSGKTIDEII